MGEIVYLDEFRRKKVDAERQAAKDAHPCNPKETHPWLTEPSSKQ
jgi:hypothetical protein